MPCALQVRIVELHVTNKYWAFRRKEVKSNPKKLCCVNTDFNEGEKSLLLFLLEGERK